MVTAAAAQTLLPLQAVVLEVQETLRQIVAHVDGMQIGNWKRKMSPTVTLCALSVVRRSASTMQEHESAAS